MLSSPFTRSTIERVRMKISYDEECDAMSITFKDTTVTSQRVTEGVALEFDAGGHLAGIEILDAVQKFGTGETLQQVLLENVGAKRRDSSSRT